jgi:hypothetical protein
MLPIESEYLPLIKNVKYRLVNFHKFSMVKLVVLFVTNIVKLLQDDTN